MNLDSRLSCFTGASAPPLIETTISEYFFRIAEQFAEILRVLAGNQ